MGRPGHRGRLRGAQALRAGLLFLLAAGLRSPADFEGIAAAGHNHLSWKPVRGAAGYRISRSLSSGGPYVEIARMAGAASSGYEDSEVANGRNYYYVLASYDEDWRESDPTGEIQVTADTVNPAATLDSTAGGERFCGSGPNEIHGSAMDAASGVKRVRVGIKRNDTGQWWTGAGWGTAPEYLAADLNMQGASGSWKFPCAGVDWAEDASYYLAISVEDKAGFVLNPAAGATIYIDKPPVLKAMMSAAPGAVTVGQTVQVSLLIANTGGTEARNVVPLQPRIEGDARLKLEGKAGEEKIASLAPGDFATVSWTFKAEEAGIVILSGGAEAMEPVGRRAISVRGVESNRVLVRRPARLAVSVTPMPVNVREGAFFKVLMRVTNAGEASARVESVMLESLKPKLLLGLDGPDPDPPFVLEGGESKELFWTASAAGAGKVAFRGSALGIDATSGAEANADLTVSEPVGVAASPSVMHLAASAGSAGVGKGVTLTAILRDQSGTPVPGSEISFGLLAGEGRLAPEKAMTDELGKAETELTIGGNPGIRTVQARTGGLLAGISVEGVLPGGMAQYLSRNYFDPGRKETVDVSIYLPRVERVRVRVLNMAGEVVRELADEKAKAGDSKYTWDGRDEAGKVVPNGVYFFSVRAGKNLLSRRVIVLKR